MEELRILSPTGMLGYGFPLPSFEAGMKKKPHAIGVDAGSTDPGPYYLGAGVSFTEKRAVKRDLEIMISAGIQAGIPVIIGSAGGSGGKPHLDWTVEIVREIAREKGLRFDMAIIHADVAKEKVLSKMRKGEVKPLYPAPELTEEDVHQAVRIVGQMGTEPFVRALKENVQVIVAGRAYDPAVIAAMAMMKGHDQGLAVHMGKILECACIAATPGSGSDCMIGYLERDHFRVEPLNPIRRCTTLSVAAHTLYEKTDPYLLPFPGGLLDLSEARFEQETPNMVRVSGSRSIPAEKYTIKLEGVKKIGYRTVSIASTRDPIMIRRIDDVVKAVKERVRENFTDTIGDYFLDVKIYGKNGTMGNLEPEKEIRSHELGIVIDAVAQDQATANTVCGFVRATMLHYGYEGRVATAGNLAFPYSPSDFRAGEVYVFNVYHLIEVDDPNELFPMEVVKSI